MAKLLENRNLYRITCYLPPPTYENLRRWMDENSVRSDSRALLTAPRNALFPENYSEGAVAGAFHAEMQGLRQQLEELQQQSSRCRSPGNRGG